MVELNWSVFLVKRGQTIRPFDGCVSAGSRPEVDGRLPYTEFDHSVNLGPRPALRGHFFSSYFSIFALQWTRFTPILTILGSNGRNRGTRGRR